MQKNSSQQKKYNSFQQPFEIINYQINKLSQLFQGEDMLTKQIYTALNQSDIQNEFLNCHKNQLSQYEGDLTTKSIPFEQELNALQQPQINLEQNQRNNFSEMTDQSCTIIINGHISFPKQKNEYVSHQKMLSQLYFNDEQSRITALNRNRQKMQLKFEDQTQCFKKANQDQKTQCLRFNKKIIAQNQTLNLNEKPLNKNVSSVFLGNFSKQKIIKNLSLKKQIGLNKETLKYLHDKKQLKKGTFSTNRKQASKKQKVNKSLNTNKLTYSGQFIYINKHSANQKVSGSEQTICDQKKSNSKTKTVPLNSIVKQDIYSFKKGLHKSKDKVNKKLNRINICQLQQNMKKGCNKDNQIQKSVLKQVKNQLKNKQKKQERNQLKLLKLNFQQNLSGNTMEKYLKEKESLQKYNTEKRIYSQISQKIDCKYWKQLRKQIESPAENSILKIKIVSLVISFFCQFSSKNINLKANSRRNALYKLNVYLNKKKQQKQRKSQMSLYQEQKISKILQHPQEIVQMINTLPSRLYESNIVSQKYLNQLFYGYQKLNDELDQQLDFFVLKKTLIFQYLHGLCQYLSYLIQKRLLQKTLRNNVNGQSIKSTIQGYYSSRGQNGLKSNKKKPKNRQFDSDRKKTISDQQDKVSRIWEVLNDIKRKNL